VTREYEITVRIRVDTDESHARWAWWASKRTSIMQRWRVAFRDGRAMRTNIEVLGSSVKPVTP